MVDVWGAGRGIKHDVVAFWGGGRLGRLFCGFGATGGAGWGVGGAAVEGGGWDVEEFTVPAGGGFVSGLEVVVGVGEEVWLGIVSAVVWQEGERRPLYENGGGERGGESTWEGRHYMYESAWRSKEKDAN